MKQISFELPTRDVKPGMILNQDVHANGFLLLAKGTIIKTAYIQQMVMRGVTTVNVLAGEADLAEILSNPVEQFYTETYSVVADIIDRFKNEIPVTASSIFPIVEKIIETVFNNQNSMLLLTGFRGNCDYYYAHSLDVCIYSLITAKALNLDYNDVVTLGLGALLHDIGKVKIPNHILFKQGILTPEEFEEVKKHSKYGYEMIIRIPDIKRTAAQVALQHHERCDGSGYPQKLIGSEISNLAKIVAIADIYDALTSDKVYKKKILPHEAAEYLLCISGIQTAPVITKVFLQNIAIYPPGCQVLLNTNQIAIITDSNPSMPLRPVINIITDNQRRKLHLPIPCDLESNPHISIVQVFN